MTLHHKDEMDHPRFLASTNQVLSKPDAVVNVPKALICKKEWTVFLLT